MGDHELVDLLERAAPAPAKPLDIGGIERRTHRRRRRHQATLAMVGLLAVAVIVVLVASLMRSPEPDDVIAGQQSPGSPPVAREGDNATVGIAFLDGTRLDMTVPEGIVADVAEVQLAGSIYAEQVGELGWRIDVVPGSVDELGAGGEPMSLPASSAPTAARFDREERRLWLQFGSWVAIASGDSLTEADAELLVDGIELAATPDGSVEYQGSLPLWVVDSPDAHLGDGSGTLGSGPVSVFFRDCSEPSPELTPTGLTFTRVDDPTRGSNLVVLCDVASRIEIWLDTAAPLSDEEIAQVDVELLAIGSSLSAVQEGRHP